MSWTGKLDDTEKAMKSLKQVMNCYLFLTVTLIGLLVLAAMLSLRSFSTGDVLILLSGITAPMMIYGMMFQKSYSELMAAHIELAAKINRELEEKIKAKEAEKNEP